jgi:hypothetical protein
MAAPHGPKGPDIETMNVLERFVVRKGTNIMRTSIARSGASDIGDARPFAGDIATARMAPEQTRRRLFKVLLAGLMLPWIESAFADPLGGLPATPPAPEAPKYPLYEEAMANVIPPGGYQSQISLKDCVPKLVQHHVIDPAKYFALRRAIGKLPDELSHVLSEPSNQPVRLTRQNAGDYVDLLWPLGLSNHMAANLHSPLLGLSFSDYASTGGWTLGKHPVGSIYFDKFPIVEMSPAAEALAVRVAKTTFRPCCDNSTFFQDCNHGSALLGVLQLGASQGLSEDDLYREALAFNSFWFPDYYVRTALYFKVARKIEWRDVDPKLVMGPDFSTQSGWQQNVVAKLQAIPNLIPPPRGGANCGT